MKALEQDYAVPDEIDFASTVPVVGGLFDPDPSTGMERIADVAVDSRTLTMFLVDGRVFSAPLEWYPELARATQEQRQNRLIRGRGRFVLWSDLRFAISPLALIKGIRTARRPALRRKSA